MELNNFIIISGIIIEMFLLNFAITYMIFGREIDEMLKIVVRRLRVIRRGLRRSFCAFLLRNDTRFGVARR